MIGIPINAAEKITVLKYLISSSAILVHCHSKAALAS